MSGGSYDYLCIASDLQDLVSKRYQLEPMADALIQTPGAEAAADETLTLIAEMKAFEVRAKVHLRRLSPVWKAIEWRDSFDGDHVAEAISAYENSTTSAVMDGSYSK